MTDKSEPKETGKSGTETKTDQRSTDLKVMLAPIVAIVVLLVFALFVVYMMGQTAANEIEWAKKVGCSSGVRRLSRARTDNWWHVANMKGNRS